MRRALIGMLFTACGSESVMVMHTPAATTHDESTRDAGTRDAGTMPVVPPPSSGSCRIGDTQACYTGNPAQAGVGACKAGVQTCVTDSEFPEWGLCEGSVLPSAEICNGIDDDCNGQVDENLTQACASSCGNTGTEVCSNGSWGACNAPACPPCIQSPSLTAWQINAGEGPTCWPQSFAQHGDVGEYQYSTIPPENDPGWGPHAAPNISFNDPSTMCGVNGAPDLCACLAGGDFTYFQTSFDLPTGFSVTSLAVNIADVDDGVRVSIFNSSFPNGVSGGYAFLGGGSTSDFAQYVAAGKNRIVLTHIDDCCRERRIANATIALNGGALNACP